MSPAPIPTIPIYSDLDHLVLFFKEKRKSQIERHVLNKTRIVMTLPRMEMFVICSYAEKITTTELAIRKIGAKNREIFKIPLFCFSSLTPTVSEKIFTPIAIIFTVNTINGLTNPTG